MERLMDNQDGTQLDIFDKLALDSDSQFVLHLIQGRIGRQSAISVSDISELTSIPPRTVRDIVKNLIEHHLVRIGSALGSPSGYYIIRTKEEAEQNERTLRKLGISILVRAAVLRKLTIKEYLRHLQGELKLQRHKGTKAQRQKAEGRRQKVQRENEDDNKKSIKSDLDDCP